MARWYPAHSYTALNAYAIQAVPNPGAYTDLVTGDMCLVYYDGEVHVHRYDSTNTDAESIPDVIVPDGNATGTGRWIKLKWDSDHEELDGLLGGAASDHYHLTLAQHSDLTDGGYSNLHLHTQLMTPNGETGVLAVDDSWVALYYNNQMAVTTSDRGVAVFDTSGTTVRIEMGSSVPALQAWIESTSTNMTVQNAIDEGHVILSGSDSGSNITTLVVADPDGPVELYYDGTKEAETISGGLKATNSLTIAGTTNVTGILDEDNLISDSPVSLATQQSIKAYVDFTAVAYTSSGAIAVADKFVELDGTAGALAMTHAAPVKGKTLYITCTNADNDCVVSLTSGDFYFVETGINDSGSTATFNTVGQTLALFGVSATRYIVLQNIGNIGIE